LAVANDSLQQAVSLYEQGALDEAQAKFESLQNADPKHAETYYYLGLIQQSRGEHMEAAEYFEEAVDLDQQQSRYYQGLGEAYGSASQNVSTFKQMRLAGKIRDAFKRSVELDGDNIEARSGLIIYYVNAPAIAGGSEEKALEQAREIGKRDTFRGHLALAAVYQSQDDDQATEREYRAAIKDSPDEMRAYQALGIFLTSKERFDEAMAVYESALKANPGDMGVTYQLGRTASISGDYPERGVAAFTRYLEYTPLPDEPGLDWANYRLGLIYQDQGNVEQAKLYYQQALAINADHPEAKKALKKINR
jgi:tetratricopeptide (TPR) repeat protein